MMHNDPYDELAALFLTDPGGTIDPTGGPPGEPGSSIHAAARVTICHVGNLPVRAGLWVAPYAAALARNDGATALLHIDGPTVAGATVDLFNVAELADKRLSGLPFRDVIEEMATEIRHWVVRLPQGVSADIAINAEIETVHVLTSADEMALVAVYQTVKSLVEAAQHKQLEPPRVELAVMGAPLDRAKDAAERLSRTTLSFLGVRTPLAVCLPRVEHDLLSCGHVTVEDDEPRTISEIIRMIQRASALSRNRFADVVETRRSEEDRDEMGIRSVRDTSTTPTSGGASARGREHDRPEHLQSEASDVVTPLDLTEFADLLARELTGDTGKRSDVISRPPSPSDDAAVAKDRRQREYRTADDDCNGASAATFRLRPRPTDPASPPGCPKGGRSIEVKAEEAQKREPVENGRPLLLSDHVSGLCDLPVRCPDCEHIEIAADGDGGLHILGWQHDLADALRVRGWIRRHRELVATLARHVRGRLSGDCDLDARGAARLHLFARQPLDVVGLHESEVFLHVLAPVDVAGKRGWYTAPLNQPVRLV